MKRNLVTFLTLLLVMALLLAGCGDKADDIGGTVEATPPDAQTQDQTTDESSLPDNMLSLGRMDGGTYTNTYAGLGCKLDESWTFYGAEELQSIPDEVYAMFEEGSKASELLENTDIEIITDMMAENATLLCQMSILFQKVSLQDRLFFAATDDDEMIDILIDQNMDMFKESYTQLGMEISSIEPITVTFLGEERTGLYTTGSLEGIPVYMTQLFNYSRGAYAVTLTFTSYVEDNTQTMLDLFYALD